MSEYLGIYSCFKYLTLLFLLPPYFFFGFNFKHKQNVVFVRGTHGVTNNQTTTTKKRYSLKA